MVDDLRALALHQLDHRLGLADVPDNQLGAPLEGLVQILAPARGQVVEGHGLVPALDQGIDQMGADEARAACYQGLHALPIGLA